MLLYSIELSPTRLNFMELTPIRLYSIELSPSRLYSIELIPTRLYSILFYSPLLPTYLPAEVGTRVGAFVTTTGVVGTFVGLAVGLFVFTGGAGVTVQTPF